NELGAFHAHDNKDCVGRCLDGQQSLVVQRLRMLSIIRRHTVTAMAGQPGTAVRRGYTVQAATVRRIEDPPEVDGVLGTAVRQATRYRAAIVRPIKVRSAAIRDADGTAIKLKLTPAQRYLFG